MGKKKKHPGGRPLAGDSHLLRVTIRATAEQYERWQEAADEATDGNRSLWIRETLDKAAEKVLKRKK